MAEPLIPKHGGYRNLKSFQVARLVYDVTVDFVDRFVDPKSRTRDQMVQAARSGVQNIAEGSQASGTSKKMELKLTNVARASPEELKLDYEDFLRHRGLAAWRRDDPRRQRLIDSRPVSLEDVVDWMEEASGAPGEPSTASTQSTSAQWESEALSGVSVSLDLTTTRKATALAMRSAHRPSGSRRSVVRPL